MLAQPTLNAIYAASIVGGIFVIICALCLCLLIRSRRKKARRRRLQEELEATAKPRRQIFVQQQAEVPPGMAERFRRKDEHIRATFGEAHPMHTPNDQLMLLPPVHLPARRSFLGLDGGLVRSERTYTPTIISRLSKDKLKMAVDWLKIAPTRTILPKPGVLKNQASKPNLAPRKLVRHNHQPSDDTTAARPLSL